MVRTSRSYATDKLQLPHRPGCLQERRRVPETGFGDPKELTKPPELVAWCAPVLDPTTWTPQELHQLEP